MATTTSKFGKDGTRTAREDKPALLLGKGKDEFVSYEISISGAAASFAFSDTHHALKRADQFPGHPLAVYKWQLQEADLPDADETYTVSFSFVAATRYTLTVKHHKKDGTVIETHKDVDLTSSDPTDEFREPLRIFLV
jgi:hypothetical protein